MKAYLVNMHLQVPRSRSSTKVKVKYKGYISQKMAFLEAFMFHKYILFKMFSMQSVSSNHLIATFQLSSAASLNSGWSQNGVLGNGLTQLT